MSPDKSLPPRRSYILLRVRNGNALRSSTSPRRAEGGTSCLPRLTRKMRQSINSIVICTVTSSGACARVLTVRGLQDVPLPHDRPPSSSRATGTPTSFRRSYRVRASTRVVPLCNSECSDKEPTSRSIRLTLFQFLSNQVASWALFVQRVRRC